MDVDMTDTEFVAAGRGKASGEEDSAPADSGGRGTMIQEASEAASPKTDVMAAPDTESRPSAFHPSSERPPHPAGTDSAVPTPSAGKREAGPESTEPAPDSAMPSFGRPAVINDPPPDDSDAPLDIPWGKVVVYLIIAWAIFRFAWLIFEIGG
jgi:hypothetical protein